MFSADYLQQLVIALPAILLALTFHEVAHGWVADRLGDPTARMMGRLNLNPIVHLDPMGTLAFAISIAAGMGFGWAKPVPVNPENFANPRRDMMWVAVAGPATNFVLAIASLVLLVQIQRFGLTTGTVGEPVALMLRAGFLINTALASFNLIPILPFDGGRILVGLLPRKLAWQYSQMEPYGFFIVLGLIFLGLLRTIMWPIFLVLQSVELAVVRALLQLPGL